MYFIVFKYIWPFSDYIDFFVAILYLIMPYTLVLMILGFFVYSIAYCWWVQWIWICGLSNWIILKCHFVHLVVYSYLCIQEVSVIVNRQLHKNYLRWKSLLSLELIYRSTSNIEYIVSMIIYIQYIVCKLHNSPWVNL